MQPVLFYSRRIWAVVGPYAFLLGTLVVECLVFDAVARWRGEPSFLSVASMVNVLDRATVYGVLSVGMTYVILTGGIDLSVGSMAAMAGVVCALVLKAGGEPVLGWLFAGYAAAAALGLAAGSVSGLVVTRFRIPPFIATLALMSSLRGLGNIFAGGRPVSPLPSAYTFLGRYRILERVPVSVVVMLAVFLVGGVILNGTRFGRHVRAIGGSEESARLSGVRVDRVKWLVYCMCSALAALGGLIVSSKLGSGDPKIGLGYELGVIAAVVVGGTSLSGGRGTIQGTFLGLLIIATLEAGLNWIDVKTFGQQVTLGAVILAAVLFDQMKHR